MKIKKYIIIIIIVIVSSIASFVLGMKYSTTKKYNWDKTCYLRGMHNKMVSTAYHITAIKNNVDEINKNKGEANAFKDILEELSFMINACDEGTYYMFDDLVQRETSYNLSQSFRLIKKSVEEGIVLDGERICYGFWEDKVISENEILFLDSVQKELDIIIDNMHEENTTNVRLELSTGEFDQIVSEFTRKYEWSNVTELGLKN
ncbi:hypothetical protein [Clostridium sp. UBA5119]|uniref:hypothetical protein n=1 Tax=Clostridium sp. UBA5119 TaxID=1946366 RepID=UPI003216E65F